MKIILATGIYPPTIGGPATYVKALAGEFSEKGMEVVVVTYERRETLDIRRETSDVRHEKSESRNQKAERVSQVSGLRSQVSAVSNSDFSIIKIVPNGGPFLRWWRYARVLKREGKDAGVIIAFSSVSAGIPLWLSRLKKPRKYLRLGGDFLWERYTDRGGIKGLRVFYGWLRSYQLGAMSWKIGKLLMGSVLRSFDHIVFSTRFQEEICEKYYDRLPPHSVIENALPKGCIIRHERHPALRLLFMGRFVGFKNLSALLHAVALQHQTPLHDKAVLTLAGDGPEREKLRHLANELGIHKSVVFRPPVHGEEKRVIFEQHDLLVLPSITEISPNVALEARSDGLPVLLSRETGLSEHLTQGMLLRDLRTPEQISAALQEVHHLYPQLATDAASPPLRRGWKEVAEEWLQLVSSAL